jgi:hypothetical protein
MPAVSRPQHLRGDLVRLVHRDAESAGLLLLASDDSITRADAVAVARARVRTASGHWLLVRGSTFGAEVDAPTAVVIEAERPHELAPLIAEAYGLTERERAVTRLVARMFFDHYAPRLTR